MTKDYAWNTRSGLGATEEGRATDTEQSSALCLSLAPLPTPSLPILTSERWLVALSNFLSSALYLFQLLRAHNNQIRKIFKNEFKSNEINHRNTLHLWLYILGQEIFEEDYLTRGVEERNKKTTKAFLDHMKWEVTSRWLVFLSALISPQFHVSLPDCTHQNSIEGDGCANLLKTKEITAETVSETQRESCKPTSVKIWILTRTNPNVDTSVIVLVTVVWVTV